VSKGLALQEKLGSELTGWSASVGGFRKTFVYFVMWLYWFAEFTTMCGSESSLVPDPEECYRHVDVGDRKRGMVTHTVWVWVKAVSRRKPVNLKFHLQPLVT